MKKILAIGIVVAVFIFGCKKEKKSASLATITTTAASSVTSNSLKSGGNITSDGGGGITQRGIAWAPHATPTVGDSITNDGSGSGSFISTLNILNANTTYYIRAYATNSAGTAYGNEITVTTQPGVPSITTTDVIDLQPLSAKSGGNITNDGGSPVTERGVVYATTPNPTTSNFKITSGTGTGTFTTTLTPLASQQVYYVRAYATNGYGTAYGNQIQFTASSANTVTDIDGNVYPYITLCGGATWMTTNLKTTKYRNGNPITDGSAAGFNWFTYTNGAYSYPNGQASNNNKYGKIYNREAITDSRGICPTGWHIPTDQEFGNLETCVGMDPNVVFTLGERFAPNGATLLYGGSSGLDITKGGQLFVDQITGQTQFSNFDVTGIYWSSSLNPSGFHRYRTFNSSNDPTKINRSSYDRSNVSCVRCVKD